MKKMLQAAALSLVMLSSGAYAQRSLTPQELNKLGAFDTLSEQMKLNVARSAFGGRPEVRAKARAILGKDRDWNALNGLFIEQGYKAIADEQGRTGEDLLNFLANEELRTMREAQIKQLKTLTPSQKEQLRYIAAITGKDILRKVAREKYQELVDKNVNWDNLANAYRNAGAQAVLDFIERAASSMTAEERKAQEEPAKAAEQAKADRVAALQERLASEYSRGLKSDLLRLVNSEEAKNLLGKDRDKLRHNFNEKYQSELALAAEKGDEEAFDSFLAAAQQDYEQAQALLEQRKAQKEAQKGVGKAGAQAAAGQAIERIKASYVLPTFTIPGNPKAQGDNGQTITLENLGLLASEDLKRLGIWNVTKFGLGSAQFTPATKEELTELTTAVNELKTELENVKNKVTADNMGEIKTAYDAAVNKVEAFIQNASAINLRSHLQDSWVREQLTFGVGVNQYTIGEEESIAPDDALNFIAPRFLLKGLTELKSSLSEIGQE